MSKTRPLTEPPRSVAWSSALGRNVRTLRTEAGLTVEALATQAGVSSGLIGQVQRGVGNPSLGNVHKLASALGVSMYELLEDDAGAPERPAPSATVVRRDQRKRISFPQQPVTFELLTPDLKRSVELTRTVMPPGYDSGPVPYQHQGEDAVYIVRGLIEAHVGSESYLLEPGDTITFDASVPHWWRNAGEEEGESIGATVPPSF